MLKDLSPLTRWTIGSVFFAIIMIAFAWLIAAEDGELLRLLGMFFFGAAVASFYYTYLDQKKRR